MDLSEKHILDKLGLQRRADDSFTARMRFHQSWWRSERLGVEYGAYPQGTAYGNYLRAEDAAKGLNFLDPQISLLAQRSAGPHVERVRNETNLLSSQPMAFNLFGPLSLDGRLAARLLDPLVPGGAYTATVEIEATPQASTHLQDRTSFDALIRYVTRSGEHGLIAIETKLTEPFSDPGANSRADRPSYREVAASRDIWIDPHSPDLANTRMWQLWRNHLLVEKVRDNTGFPISVVMQWVIHHDEDRNCIEPIRAYRASLKTPDTVFRSYALSQIIGVWSGLAENSFHRAWLSDFRSRYLDLSLSARLWSEYAGGRGSSLEDNSERTAG